jgi:TolA-binding protein
MESERQAREDKRQADVRAAEAARLESERQAAEAKRQAEARASEAARIERERQAAETARLAEAHAAEAARPSEASGVAAASAAAGAPNHGKSGGAEAEPGTTPFSGVFVSAKPVRAVDKPVPGGKTVATIQPWQRLAVTGRTENGDWLRVGIDGQNRWVAAQDVVPERTAEELAWSRISKDAGAGVLATFLKRFPDGAYAERAKDRLAQVRSQEKARSDMARDLAEEEATGGGSAEARRSGSSRPASLPTGSTAATEAIPSRSGASGGEATASAPAPRDGDVEHGGLPGVAMSELYDQAMALVARRDYPGAERLLQRIATEPASGQIGVTAKYRLADILLKEGDYARSAIAFAEFQQSYPQDSNLPNALLGYAEALGQLGRRSEACLGLIKLTKQFPGVSPEMKEQQRAAMRRFSC